MPPLGGKRGPSMKQQAEQKQNKKVKTSGISGILVTDLGLIVTVLFLVITINVMDVNAERCREIMANLTSNQSAGLMMLDILAGQPPMEEIQDAVDRRIEQIEEEREAWLAAQDVRVEKAKEERLIQERYNAALKEAKENTARTWHGTWSGAVLSRGSGTITGPSGKETYYNLNMSGVVRIMRSMGFSEEIYPYEVREDGVKTLGGYVMVAANLGIRPRGSFIMTSRGVGLVCDTGGFASRNPTQLDLAVTW